MLKIYKKLQEKRFVFVKILAIIIPENGAKISKVKCLQLNQKTLNIDYRSCQEFPIVTGKNHGAGKPAVADHT